MVRPLYPNDDLKVVGNQNEGADHSYGVLTPFNTQTIVSLDQFGSVDLDSGVLYDVNFGGISVRNGTIAAPQDARDGAEFVVNLKVRNNTLGGTTIFSQRFYTLRKGPSHYTLVDSVRGLLRYSEPTNVSLSAEVAFGNGIITPGGDINGDLPAPATTSTTSETTTGASLTEVRDTNLGNYQFTARAGRTYRVALEGMRVGVETGATGLPLLPVVRIRDGGGSTPTTSSTIVAEARTSINTAGGVGQRELYVAVPLIGLSAGTHTLGAFILDGNGANNNRRAMVGTRYLYVTDITRPSSISDGSIEVFASSLATPALRIKPAAEPEAVNLIPLL